MTTKYTETHRKIKDSLQSLTPQDFKSFGLGHIAYIRPYHFNGKDFFTVFAANGNKLYTSDAIEDAVQLSRQDNLEPVTVH
ncbi:MAG: DUF1150 domain-containing protein [Alphaproteobacteria bacterium]|nr:DUF1150 domain-containing protein [Alphaproteobacteria bacterium]